VPRQNKSLLLLVALSVIATIAACEVPTRVAIYDAKNPPTFKLSGNGELFHFIVVGPYSSAKELSSPASANVEAIWQLSVDESAYYRVDELPPITYGQVPKRFKQDIPQQGSPPPLEPGKFYSVGSPTLKADFKVFCFKVESDAVVAVACD